MLSYVLNSERSLLAKSLQIESQLEDEQHERRVFAPIVEGKIKAGVLSEVTEKLQEEQNNTTSMVSALAKSLKRENAEQVVNMLDVYASESADSSGKTALDLGMKTAAEVQNLFELVASASDLVSYAREQITVLQSLTNTVSVDLTDHSDYANMRHSLSELKSQRQSEAMVGNMKLVESVGAEDVSAATLNASAVGTFRKQFSVSLSSELPLGEGTADYPHIWANFAGVVSSAEAVADADVAAPTVEDVYDRENPPDFVSGVVVLEAIFDTDAGATKTYVDGESVTVTVKVASDDKLLGYTVTELVKTYNVVA